MNLDLKTSLVAVPVLVHVLIVKVVTGYWELQKWMDFRMNSGEMIKGKSWVATAVDHR